MSEKKKDIDVVEALTEESTPVRIYKLISPNDQLFVMQESEIQGCLVLVNFPLKVGFAIPFEFAHQLSHMIHEGLVDLTGGDPCDDAMTQSEKKITLH